MFTKTSYRLLYKGLKIALGVGLLVGLADAQGVNPNAPTETELYCSGVVTTQPLPRDSYVISGENSAYQTTFAPGQYIYINRGAEHGVKVGDQFEVDREVTDMSQTKWFKYQPMLSHAMGIRYADIGRLRVVHVNAKTSTAALAFDCLPVQRGDLLRPFAPRPVPQFHDVKFDPFAAPSGKKTAMIVSSKDFMVLAGVGRVVYVNLGSAQGVRVGDYFRAFRYQGTQIDMEYQITGMAYKAYGFGSTPVAYSWNDLPRQVLGEGIVLRTGPNSSSVLLTTARFEIYAGDYVELE